MRKVIREGNEWKLVEKEESKIVVGYTLVGGKKEYITISPKNIDKSIKSISKKNHKMGKNSFIEIIYPKKGCHISNCPSYTHSYFDSPNESLSKIKKSLKEDGYL